MSTADYAQFIVQKSGVIVSMFENDKANGGSRAGKYEFIYL